jgi:hypothetical protein
MSLLNIIKDGLETARVPVGSAALSSWNTLTNVFGLDSSNDMSDHYRYGDGKDVYLPPEKIREDKTISRGEKNNQHRLLNSITKSKKIYNENGDVVNLEDVKENERIYLDDYYDVDSSKEDVLNNRDYDLYGSLGSHKLRSKSKMSFVKSNNKLLPYGYVEHNIEDTYDFNGGTSFNLLFSPLEKAGQAKPYKIKSKWKNYPIGVTNIKNNILDTSGIEWITK